MKLFNRHRTQGQITLEPVIAIAIFALVITPFLSSITNLLSFQVRIRHQSRAVHYAREGLEIAYNLAVNHWVEIHNHSGAFHPSNSGSLQLLSGSEKLEDRYQREITIAPAKRNSEGNIDEKTGQEDPKTIKVISKVSWSEKNRPESVEFTSFLIDLSKEGT